MNKKFIVLMMLLVAVTCGTTINVADKCSVCTQYKSQADCQVTSGCTWTAAVGTTAGSCGKTTDTTQTNNFIAYCPSITSASGCAGAFGCAYLDGKCTHFAGCSAYVKTTTSDCQAISYLCISNGTTCTDTLECKDYDQNTCESTPNMFKRKCKWDTTCRTYTCLEADSSLTSNSACDAFSAGCVTTGAGCVAPDLPNCALLPGNEGTCPNMKGGDGKCKFVSGTTCALKLCSDYQTGTPSDADCIAFQSFCLKSTGKGCAASLDKCSSFAVANAATDCTGYVGSDGVCEGDANATACRARKCENGVGTTNEACANYRVGCVTNGVKCADAKSLCSQYTGTTTSCLTYLGSDGLCKGLTATSGPCALRDCEVDSKAIYTTDTLCQSNIQATCLSNGAGCVKTLPKCNTYTYTSTDGAECNSKLGSDFRCKAATGGKCTARLCTDAPTSTTTTDACIAYQTGCVTNGAGCVAATSCGQTIKEKSCSGTIETAATTTCNWNAICVSNSSCGQFLTPALCQGYPMKSGSNSYPCIWDSSCRRAVCTDYTGASYANDTACENALPGCVYNGVSGCVLPGTCSNFKGIKATCLGFKAYCTNTDSAAASEVCISKTCNDVLTYTTDNDCQNYLSGCLTDGSGCIANTAACASYAGTPDECDKFWGYYSSKTQNARCWNIVSTSGACTEKLCSHATSGMTQDSDCETFLKGCLFNGNGGCVTPSSSCSAYTGGSTGVCSAFKGDSGLSACWWSSGSYCTTKACSHDGTSTTDTECNTFLPNCVTKGTGCTTPTTACSSYLGTAALCNAYSNKVSATSTIKCTRLENCVIKTCANKIDASTNADCLAYHLGCRLTYGTAICVTEKAACTSYVLTGTVDADKQTYCNQITTDNNTTLCGYNPGSVSACAVRTCPLWVNTLTTPCVDYLGTATCRLANGLCYASAACTSYTIASGVTDKVGWCNAMLDNTTVPLKCTYVSGAACVAVTTCETVVSPTSAAYCNTLLNATNCQYYGGKCYTTATACTSYLLANITATNYSAYCSALKQDATQNITWCKYGTGTTNCVAKTCADVASPTSQASCDLVVDGCNYLSGVCYTSAACASYAFPAAYSTDDTTKRLFCQNMYDAATADLCSFTASGTTCTTPLTACTALTTSYTSLALCQIWRDKTGKICSWIASATACSVPVDAATNCANILGTVDNDTYCNLRTTVGSCRKASGSATCEAMPAACTSFAYTGSSDDAKATSCQVFKQLTGEYCSWFTSATTTCELSKATCANWSGLTATTDNTAFCRARIAQTGQLCAYDLGQTACRDRLAWEDATSLQSQADCDIYATTSIYQAGSCHIPNASCALYLAVGATDDAKLAYCNVLTNTTSAGPCTFIKGSNYCSNKAACTSYTISGLADKATKQSVCQAIPTTDSDGCTYWGTGTTCTLKVACASYTAGDSADCSVQKAATASGLSCIILSGSATACSAPASCEVIASPASQADCDKFKTGCYFAASKCNTLSACGTYATGGSGATAYCNAMRDNSLTAAFCKAASDTAANCASRACADVSYSTHAQCQSYLSTCKSNGSTCVASTDACTAQSGIPSFCSWALDIDGVSSCIDGTPATTNAACVDRTCTQNVTATSDSECDSYLLGCLTDGAGCIAKTETCSKYYGTTSICKAFTGNSIKCWGSSDTVTGPCRDRVCTDNTSATSNDECEAFLTGCLTTGAGCITKTAACSSYKGTKDQCSNFLGSNKSIYCYNTTAATATTACKDRACSDSAATSDADCAAFIKSTTSTPICVTNGSGCVPYPKACSDFKGTETTCPKFTATDGPCKTTTYTTTAASCTPKVCSEAPNNLITDADCIKYHPSCVTTGRGCMKGAITCGDVQSSTACTAKSACVWANQCRSAPTSCSTLTAQGQTICVNTPLANKSMCAWSGSACRGFLCTDYDASYTTHEKCNVDTSCTTSGAGCVPIGICSSYKTPAICAAATTSETSKRCTWTATATTSGCRARLCSDSSLTTDDECDAFLKGCKTSGSGCVGPIYGCSVFSGNEKYCLKNSEGTPCLYVNKVCYDYADCSDATATTLTGCQLFNGLCVPTSTTTCTAQTSCDKYTTQQSCTVGISNTVCGWLPTGKCQIYGACSDALGTSNTDCSNYGSKCITDGVKCVDIGKCDSYLTLTSCGNNGTDGACSWVAASNSCRLRQCIDKSANSDADCSSYIVTTGICTTDGTTCVARAACTTYGAENACTIGSDGIPCIFSYPVGTTSGTKSCRAKECSDVTGASNDLCIGQIAGKACVSNGKICVKQDACANYKNKVSCNGGGSDGICAFTAAATTADPLAGSCVAFSSCDKANNDQSACVKNTAACQWTSTVSGTVTTTTCAAKSCVQAASGTTCNPVPSFDKKTYTICALVNNVCTASDPGVLTSTNCLTKSVYTYTWSESSSKCVSCTGTSTSTNNTTNTNTTTNTTNDTTTTNGYILGITVPLFIMGLFA